MKKRITVLLVTVLILVTMLSSMTSVLAAENYTISLDINPQPIHSNTQVVLTVDLIASADSLTAEKDKLVVTIPKNVVYGSASSISTSSSIGQFQNISADDTNYYVTLKVNTVLNEGSLLKGQFIISFRSALITEQQMDVSFNAKLGEAEDNLEVPFIHGEEATPGAVFSKYSMAPVNPENKWHQLSLQSSTPNRYELWVNVPTKQQLTNVSVSDNLPEGLILDPNATGLGIGGSKESVNGIRIKQVTDGVQKYVTDTFSGEIKVAKDLTSFSVDFGNVSPDENYIVEYRVSVNKIRESYENTATFSSDEVSHTDIVMAESYIVDHQAKLLTKKVSQERITTETKELGYNLALFAKEGPISVGSIIEDQLADTVRYGRMQDSDYFEAHYDEANNRVSFEVVKEIPFGSTEFIDFTVTPVGTLNDQETIENTASISFLDSDYYSNTVRTVVDGTGSAIVTKVDMDDETNILSGAVFKLLDGEGTLIKENLTTDRAGKIVLSELAIGAYTLVETSAPDNYILDISPINFEIRSENIMVPLEIVVENKREAAGGIEHDELPEQEDPILELPVNEDPSMPIVNKPDKDPEILEEFLDSDGPGKDSLKPGVIRGIVPEKKSRGMERSRYCYSTI